MPAIEIPGATRVSLADVVPYEDGARVNRVLLKRGGGTMTVFAFDAGQSLAEHASPVDAVAHVLEGEAEITISGQVLRVSAAEVVLLPAHQPHAVRAHTRCRMLLTTFRGD